MKGWPGRVRAGPGRNRAPGAESLADWTAAPAAHRDIGQQQPCGVPGCTPPYVHRDVPQPIRVRALARQLCHGDPARRVTLSPAHPLPQARGARSPAAVLDGRMNDGGGPKREPRRKKNMRENPPAGTPLARTAGCAGDAASACERSYLPGVAAAAMQPICNGRAASPCRKAVSLAGSPAGSTSGDSTVQRIQVRSPQARKPMAAALSFPGHPRNTNKKNRSSDRHQFCPVNNNNNNVN